MKKLANLKGANALNKKEQQSISGGVKRRRCCDPALFCCFTNPNYNGSNCQFIYDLVPGGAGCV